MAFIDLEDVCKSFDGTTVLDRVSCGLEQGEFFCILGPSGCGKTTLLRLVAGLEKIDSGSIAVAGNVLSGPDRHVQPEDRNCGIVFQSYALWPHMSVTGNVEYPLRVAKADKTSRRDVTDDALRSVRLAELAHRRPHTLSGGQQQRVALARCLTQKPELVLMDEPLANLDMHLREEMLSEFRAFRGKSRATILYITHDQAEAMSVADRVAVMMDGRLIQVADPEVLYAEPANAAVARFIGLSSVLPGRLENGGTASCLGGGVAVRADRGLKAGDAVQLCVRPEAVHVGEGPLKGRVSAVTYLGGRYLTRLSAGGESIRAYVNSGRRPVVDGTVDFAISDAWAMPAAPS